MLCVQPLSIPGIGLPGAGARPAARPSEDTPASASMEEEDYGDDAWGDVNWSEVPAMCDAAGASTRRPGGVPPEISRMHAGVPLKEACCSTFSISIIITDHASSL